MNSRIQAQISGTAKLLARLGQIQNVVFINIAREVESGALAIHSDAIKSIQDHGSSGKSVRRYNPNRIQNVSSPGSPPNTDLGTLVRSIKFEIDKANFTAVVGTNLQYGKFLELGTRNIEARPWLYPAFQRHKEEIAQNVNDAIAKAIGGR